MDNTAFSTNPSPFTKNQLVDISRILQKMTSLVMTKLEGAQRALMIASPTLMAITNLLKEFSLREHVLLQSDVHFFPEGHWAFLRSPLKISLDDFYHLYPYQWPGDLDKDNDVIMDEAETSGSVIETNVAILVLRHLSFVLTTEEKVQILHHWLTLEHEGQGRADPSRGIEVVIRRNYFVQDSFQKLYPLKKNIRQYFKIEFINQEGLKEAGIGGGVFKEFMTTLIRESFSPQYGLFSSTSTPDRTLYPNRAAVTFQDDVNSKYEFLGMLTGKLIYEMNLAELPLSIFFLKQIFSDYTITVADLSEYDEEMYNNILKMEHLSNKEIQDLGLTFSTEIRDPISTQLKSEDLIPGGNLLEVSDQSQVRMYAKALAYHHLSKSIERAVIAFKKGFSAALPINWINFFDACELKVLISGNQHPIDLDELKQNTKYSNGYYENHKTIQLFWQVVEDLSNEEQAHLLRFVTSCSRAPLLGFKDLSPTFCIHKSSLGFLPSATTCLNLLKLPPYNDYETMHQKLLYSINSKSGFELS